MRYNFIENYMSSYFGPLATMQERFLATRLEEVDRPLPLPPPRAQAGVKQKIEIEDAITEARPVPSTLPYTREQIRHLTTLLADALEERERDRAPTRSIRNAKRRMRKLPPSPPPLQ